MLCFSDFLKECSVPQKEKNVKTQAYFLNCQRLTTGIVFKDKLDLPFAQPFKNIAKSIEYDFSLMSKHSH